MYSSDAERNHFLAILKKYVSGTANRQEIEFVETYYNYLQQQPDVLDELSVQERLHLEQEFKHLLLNDMAAGDEKSVDALPSRTFGWKWPAVAAVLLISAGAAIYTYLINAPAKEIAVSRRVMNQPDMPAGGNRAVLTLADGSTIVLDSAANGALAQQGNMHIIKLNNGTLAYKGNTLTGAGQNMSFNTISTPRGGQYQIVLPDGSKVWLNAASAIKFPVVFVKERRVEISGEAYFEIAKDKEKPFKVSANGTQVQVLGTSFNVNAYKEDPAIETTLLEGSVKILNGNRVKLLNPGEQAQLTADKEIKIVKDANTAEIMAWKNGLFYFNKADVKTFMRQLERWYDIEVRYEGALPDLNFSGKMQRNLSLSQLLKILNEMEVHFRIEGRILTVFS